MGGIRWKEPFDFVVRFNKSIANSVKRRVHHPTQQFEKQKNGDIIMTIRAGGWDEMKLWALDYSYRAEVIKPEAMREEIGKELGQAAENYQRGAGKRKPPLL